MRRASQGHRYEIPSWRSVYFQSKLEVLLVLYVDDFKLAGPKKCISEAWRLIRLKIEVEIPCLTDCSLGSVMKSERLA